MFDQCFEFGEFVSNFPPTLESIVPPASVAVVDTKPDTTSLLSAFGERSGHDSTVLLGQNFFLLQNLILVQPILCSVYILNVPDDVVDAVEAWDRVGDGGCRQVVYPKSLASASSWLGVVRRDRVSRRGWWAADRTRTSRGRGGKDSRTLKFRRPTGGWDAGRKLDLGMRAPPSVIPGLGRPETKRVGMYQD